jgi:5-formyltetrahydrofolate cyclo-ligase
MTSKDQLRQSLRKTRQEFVKQYNIQEKFNQNAQALADIFMPSMCVAAYQKSGSEVSADAILAALDRLGVTPALPFISARGDAMRFKLWHPDNALIKAALGFLQPSADAPDIAPDVILVPLVGFDRNMNRLGQGAGHYDRIFTLFPSALRIGLAWSCQEAFSLPVDPWDVALDAVLTEKEWIKPAHSRIEG